MTPIAIIVMLIALGIIWGGLLVSVIFLVRRPELDSYPEGDTDDLRENSGLIEHDT